MSPDIAEPNGSPQASAPLRWLHLSDFHFDALERWSSRATLTALLQHVDKLRERGLAPDLVFVTGDVAQSGQHKEYEQAERFFTELAEKLELEPRERPAADPRPRGRPPARLGRGPRRRRRGCGASGGGGGFAGAFPRTAVTVTTR